MTYPSSDVNTANTDATGDSPALARTDVLDLMQKFNLLRNHISAFVQGLLSSADAAAARSTLIAAKSGSNTDITSLNGVLVGNYAVKALTVQFDDVTTYRVGAPTTGYYYFGNTNSKYIGYDGTNFSVVGGAFVASAFSGAGTFLTGTAGSLNAGIGASQNWQDKTSVRAFGGGPYTNSTGKPIMVSIIANTGTTSHVSVTVDGVLIATNYLSVGGGTFTATAQAIVPAESTYSAIGSGLAGWRELTA